MPRSNVMLAWQKKTVLRKRVKLFFTVCVISVLMPLISIPVKAELETKYAFHIKAQRADRAITRFARKVDIPVLFPSETVRDRNANFLRGDYELEQAMDILLDRTGLQAHFSESGQLIIKIVSEPEAEMMIINPKKRWSLTSIAAIVGAIFPKTSTAVSAQNEIVRSTTIEEVVVTAQHRAQSIQNVPISISAIGAEQLEAAGIFDAATIATNVPGMTYGEFSPGQAIISLRGVASADDGAGLDNSVGLFLDGVYIGRGAGINFDMFDMDRIEVLKGPQGTLFGRNAIGGAINVVTSKPADEFGGKAAVTVGNEGILRYQGLVTGPLSDNLSGKFVVNHREHDGFVRNVVLNKDVQDEDQTSVRGQLRWNLDSSEWLLSADYMEDERDEAGRFPLANGNFDYLSLTASLGASPLTGTSASPINGFTNREASGISLQGDIEMGSGKLTSITGLRNVETDWEMPSIGAPAGGGINIAAGVFGVDVNDDIEEEVDTFSQELRWTSESDGAFNFVAGVYYFTEDTDRQEQFRLDRNTVTLGQLVVGNEFTRTENETTSYAVYGQGIWEVNDAWTLTAGGRYTKDERDYRATAINCGLSNAAIAAAGLSTSACTFNGARIGSSLGIIAEAFSLPAYEEWDDFSPMASIQFRPNDAIMYFLTVSTGYKSGGFAGSQGVASAATTPVEPEDVISYELGFKGDFLENTLRFNATAFTMDYDDLQVVRFGPVVGSAFGTFQTTNVGSADISGVELDFIWQLTDNFKLSGNYGYLDTETNDLVLNTAGGSADFSGLNLRQSPENSYNLVANYTLLTSSSGEYDFRLQYSYVDEQFYDFPTRDETKTEDYGLIDARISWTSVSEKYSLALWGKNLDDEAYVSHAYRIGPGSIAVQGALRTVGLTGIVNF